MTNFDKQWDKEWTLYYKTAQHLARVGKKIIDCPNEVRAYFVDTVEMAMAFERSVGHER